jgi:DNA polymerase III psi subunit
MCQPFRQALFLKEDTRLFIIAERRLKGKENVVKDMVDSVEIES